MSNSPPNLANKDPNSSDDEVTVVDGDKKQLFHYMQFRPDVYITKESVGFRNHKLSWGEEGLFDPDEDLWLLGTPTVLRTLGKGDFSLENFRVRFSSTVEKKRITSYAN